MNTLEKNIRNQHNADFIYKYTKDYVESVETGLDRINQKLAGVIGFSAVLIKFAGDLTQSNNIAIIVKFFAIFLLLVSTFSCLLALRSQTSGLTTNPEELFNDWWGEDDDRIKAFVIRQWLKTIQDLKIVANRRSKLLNVAFICIGLSTLCFGINYCTQYFNSF